MSDITVKCCRCRNKHKESERVPTPCKWAEGLTTMVCPRCRATEYYRVEPVPAA